jgi:hypothetical protein
MEVTGVKKIVMLADYSIGRRSAVKQGADPRVAISLPDLCLL